MSKFRHQMQTSRFEYKYRISESTARAIRQYIRRYMEPDEHYRPEQPLGYEVRSLYLESPDLILHQATVEGKKNRFKLRIRFYDDSPHSPAFLEIKRRNTTVIGKERAGIRRDAVIPLLAGEHVGSADLLKNDARNRSALHNFCSLRDAIGAGGSLFVCYLREAYVLPDSDAARVTFDRNITSVPYTRGTGLTLPAQRHATSVHDVTLEMKFNDRFPNWMCELAQIFQLERISVPKYIECVDAAPYQPQPCLFLERDALRQSLECATA